MCAKESAGETGKPFLMPKGYAKYINETHIIRLGGFGGGINREIGGQVKDITHICIYTLLYIYILYPTPKSKCFKKLIGPGRIYVAPPPKKKNIT